MDRKYIENEQIIDRYLLNKLSDDEAIAFEEAFVGDAGLAAEIELHRGMIDGIRSHSINAAPAPRVARRNWWADFFGRPLVPVFSSALAVVFAVVIGAQFATLGDLRTENEQLQHQLAGAMLPQANTIVVPLGLTRGDNDGARPTVRVQLLPTVDRVVVVPDVYNDSFDSYRYTLARDDEGHFWSNESGSLSEALVLPAELLTPGDYYFSVFGLAQNKDETQIGEFSFTVLED